MATESLSAPDLLNAYTGQVRVRVCGLLVHHDTLLLTAHRGLLPGEAPFWSPPGGGWQFGETIQECLRREFREETGLDVTVGRFLHLHEYKADDLQAIELFFEVTPDDPAAVPRLGSDPEHAAGEQLLTQVAFVAPRELVVLPAAQVHPMLRQIISPDDVFIPQIRFQR
ncbi:NUDIX domain-containing protein [Hymenobacter sp. APR13]|jgi:8-oxo-dGTP diphosphatase|uniref:NUDIX domain-containing protein n=1 Tax=Hymenobacter sp. APR13 TaxID=1356852 RepID=UPI0004E04B35|nr:NUDIX hydrolase [Hymenobacter sp. APR13]AII53256.1 hypothetical protein N008_14880 [Hymenobacter sp. APR13]